MKQKTTLRLLTAALVLAILFCFAGCAAHEEPTEPNYEDFTNPTWAPATVESISTIVDEDSIANLDKYPGLKQVDLSGSTCYEAILAYMESHPEVEVTYTVSLGTVFVSTDSTDLILLPGTYDYDTLMANLKYLPYVANLTLPRVELSPDQISTFRSEYPDIALQYTVEFNGTEFDETITDLDLSDFDTAQMDMLLEKLTMMPFITSVELMKEDGTTNFSVEQMQQLKAAAPQAVFNYMVEVYGMRVSTSAELVDLTKCNIDDEAELRAAMELLSGVKKVNVTGSELSNETLGAIQADFPSTKLVWKVKVANKWISTDEETLFLSQSRLMNNNCENLKYITSAKYVDAGHSEKLTDVSWLAYMPDVEILILSGSPITDISSLANATKLEWLELTFCDKLVDISVVKNLTSLRFLNIGYTKVADISAINDLPLERFHALRTKVSNADFEAYIAAHPDCWTTYYGSRQPYGKGWRYDDAGYTFFEYYKKMRDIFDYDSRV